MDLEKKEAFGRRFTDILNHGALNLAMALGYQTGLFDVMHRAGTAMTCEEIADTAELSTRYVREWLGIMCTGRIVELLSHDNGEETYLLPREHGAYLARSGSDSLSVYTREIPLLTQIAMDEVAKDFSRGQGLPFEAYPRFQDFMADLSQQKLEQTLVQQFIPCVGEGALVSRLETGIRVCDLGCGQGVAVDILARAFPKSEFIGMDTHEAAIQEARERSRDLGNARFLVQDAAAVKDDSGFSGRFDYVFAFDAIHDQTRPLAALEGVRHMLAPGGWFSMIDIDAHTRIQGNMDHPMGPFLYTVSLMHCMPVGLHDNGPGLGMMWGRQKALEMLAQAGFTDPVAQDMDHDPFNVHYFCCE